MEKIDMLNELKAIYKGLDDKMAEDIVIIDVREISSLTSYFVVASGNNSNQLDAMADNIEMELKKLNIEPRQCEGLGTNWSLLDFSFAIVHLFNKESREHFNLERLWADGNIINSEILEG